MSARGWSRVDGCPALGPLQLERFGKAGLYTLRGERWKISAETLSFARHLYQLATAHLDPRAYSGEQLPAAERHAMERAALLAAVDKSGAVKATVYRARLGTVRVYRCPRAVAKETAARESRDAARAAALTWPALPPYSMAWTVSRNLLRYAVGRAISCPHCGAILDFRRAVLITADAGPAIVFCHTAAALPRYARLIAAARELPGGGVIDGRTFA